VYNGLGQPDLVLDYLGQALGVTREIGDRVSEGVALDEMGNAYRGLGQPDSALVYHREALRVRREVGHRVGESVTLWQLGYLHHRDRDTPDLVRATAYYDSASAVHSALAGGTGSDDLRLSFAEQGADFYQFWSLAWLARGEEVGEEVARLSALAASERGRGQAALALMRESLVIEPGQDLAADGASLASAITKTGATGLSYLVTGDTLLVWLIPPTGDVRVARRPIAADTLAALVDQLRWDLGVDEATRSGLAIEAHPEETRGSRGARRSNSWPGEAARRLSDLILPAELRPLLAEAGELVILPHASLNLLPFAALPLGAEGVDESEHLGSRHAIRYAPSLAILNEARSRSTGAGDPLIVGNPDMPLVATSDGTPERLEPLAGTETEAQWLGEQLGQSSMKGATATESAVRARLPDASLVHLATHGFAYGSETRARDSFVALAPGPGHDGLLTVGEVLDEVPQLQADLVVLSACQTGLGDLKQAEGTVGLQRAFLARGARSVLVSLWSVSDAATTLLMQRFYTHWLGLEGEPGIEGEPRPGKAEALRRAQEDVRATPGFEHPRFWAAFQLVGAG
jgi:CHAT domain-containing protein